MSEPLLNGTQEFIEWVYRTKPWIGASIEAKHSSVISQGRAGRDQAMHALIDLVWVFDHRPNPMDFPEAIRGAFLMPDNLGSAIATNGMTEKAMLSLMRDISNTKMPDDILGGRLLKRGYTIADNPVREDLPDSRQLPEFNTW